jgi:uncharacterized CHY-type Zn-finger protein
MTNDKVNGSVGEKKEKVVFCGDPNTLFTAEKYITMEFCGYINQSINQSGFVNNITLLKLCHNINHILRQLTLQYISI